MTSLLRVPKVLLVAGLAACLGLTFVSAQSQADQGSWEMRVCAQPDAYPISSQERPGYENRIAEVLADHLGAELTFVWTRIDGTGIRNTLQEGDCDLAFGVLDGAAGLLTTVPYHRAPYVFIYRSDAPFEIESFQDEELSELRIAVEPNSFQQQILLELGHGERLVVVPPPNVSAAGHSRIDRLLEAIDSGEADITIAYGPDAAQLGADGEYEVVAAQPEILPPFHQMFRVLTIGVRLNDDSLRDRLGIALANTWPEILEVLDEYEVPQLSVIQPSPPRLERTEVTVGAVFPMPTGGWPGPHDVEGVAARFGALAAEDLAISGDGSSTTSVRVLLANAPTVEAAERAAHRLIATEGVQALLGGIGTGQAERLAAIAEEEHVPFFNIEEDDDSLRRACLSHTFNVAPNEGIYLRGLHEALSSRGVESWFVIAEDSELGRRLFEEFAAILDEKGDELAGSEIVPATPSSYRNLLATIESSDADGVALLQSPAGQEFFLSQYRLETPVSGYPHPEMQTREYLGQLMQVVPESGRVRVVAWDPQLTEHGAENFNEMVVGRSGEPADLTAWTAFAAVEIAQQAAQEVDEGDFEDIQSYLRSEDAAFELLKGEQLSFGPGNQLGQHLYAIEIDPEAAYNQRVGARIALANVVDTLGPYASEIGCQAESASTAR